MSLFSFGFVTSIVGVVWSWVFPLNENLWTSSFVLFTSGLTAMTLAGSIFLIDLLNYRKVANLGIIYGSNAITIYVLADLLSQVFYNFHFGDASLNNFFLISLLQWGLHPKL